MAAGALKAYFNANEVITTSMLNFIAVYLLAYLVNGPMMDPEGFNFPQSPLIAEALELPRLLASGRLNVAFILNVKGSIILVTLVSGGVAGIAGWGENLGPFAAHRSHCCWHGIAGCGGGAVG